MAVSLDGFAVLGKISGNARVFADVKADASKQARALVVKQLKAKGDLETLTAVKKLLGPKSFEMIVDGLSDTEVKSLLGKLDRYNPEVKSSQAAWRREHLRSLAGGKAKPSEKPERPGAARAKASKPKPRPTLDLESMRARPKRR